MLHYVPKSSRSWHTFSTTGWRDTWLGFKTPGPGPIFSVGDEEILGLGHLVFSSRTYDPLFNLDATSPVQVPILAAIHRSTDWHWSRATGWNVIKKKIIMRLHLHRSKSILLQPIVMTAESGLRSCPGWPFVDGM